MYKIFSRGGLFVVVLFFGFVGPVAAAETVATTSTTTATSTSTPRQDQVAVEKRVRDYFVDVPVMVEIARCESKFRQFTDSGAVLRGGAGGGMIGVFQFYEQVHAKPALLFGFDLATVEGNLSYARQLYERSGTTPWNACVPAGVSTLDANTELRIVLLKKVIGLLQQLLALQLANKS